MPICENYAGGIICRGRDRRRRCPLCHEKWVELECDFEIGGGKTCDQKMCKRCATKIRGQGVSLDYCPTHKEAGLAAIRAAAGRRQDGQANRN